MLGNGWFSTAVRASVRVTSILFISSCNGSGYTPDMAQTEDPGTPPQVASDADATGLISQVVLGDGPAVVSLFSSGVVYFSPNGRNPGGGCSVATSTVEQVCTVVAYSPKANLGNAQLLQIVPTPTGVEALLDNGRVFFSPDGINLSGGGNSIAENDDCTPVQKLVVGVPYMYGLAKAVSSDLSATCGTDVKPNSLGVDNRTRNGTGNLVYVGYEMPRVIDMAALGTSGALVSLLADGTAVYSANYKTAPPSTGAVVAYTGLSSPARIVTVGGGVETAFSDGSVYLSPDGLNLGGGGRTVRVNPWVLVTPHAEFGASYGGRDSAKGTIFQGKLWLSGGFHGPQGSTTADCGRVCSFYDLWYSADWGQTWIQAQFNGAPSDNQPAGAYDSYSPLFAFGDALWALGTTLWGSANTDATGGLSSVQLSGPAPAATPPGENSWAIAVGSNAYFIDTNTSQISISSGNLTTWTPSTTMTTSSSAPFLPRCGAGVKYAFNKFWIVGGGACDSSASYNDLWSSIDGLNWDRESKPAEWSPRLWPCMAVDTYGTLWLIGGYGDSSRYGFYTQNMADVWYSTNGVDWKQYKAAAGSGLPDDGIYQPRHAPTCYVRPDTNTLIIAAGKGGSRADDLRDATNGDYAIMRDDVVSLELPAANQLP